LPDGRLHTFNEPYRALLGAHDDLTSFVAPWGSAIPPALSGALAGKSELITTQLGTDTVTLSFVPVRETETNVLSGVLVSVVKDASEQLDAFRYTLSHDLLSPLRTLQEMARILEREHSQHLPPDASIFLTHFSQGTNKLADRVAALVRFVKLNAQPLDCRRVDVSRLVQGIVAELRAAHGDKATVIVGELPDAYGDPDLIRQLFTQLLSNAFKFSRNSGDPRIEIGRDMSGNGPIPYFVMDNGAGFDMKYAGKLFGLFQRMHGEAQFEGTGAGLAIARRIVERHGGSIRAEAMKDRGAKFIFTLPSASTGASTGA
jgi:light-regulated signal transduction histidine kinase (bacteriophytochrome)